LYIGSELGEIVGNCTKPYADVTTNFIVKFSYSEIPGKSETYEMSIDEVEIACAEYIKRVEMLRRKP